MTDILIIDKKGDITCRRSKTASLCKSCNFKSDKHFKRRHTWKYKCRFWESSNNVFADTIECISLFAKDQWKINEH